MPSRIHCITLAVDDLAAALTFYRDGLGLPVPEGDLAGDADHIPIRLPGGLYLVLTLRAGFDEFMTLTGQVAAPRAASECILSYFAASEAEVDTVVARAEAAGGTVPSKAQNQPWGYAGFVKDPDGHLWEILWNPNFTPQG